MPSLKSAREATATWWRCSSGSWETVRHAGESHGAYVKALSMAEACVQISPNSANYLALVAMGQYRIGNYQDALGTFDKALARKTKPSAAPTMAFRSMALAQAGKSAEAIGELGRLRELMKDTKHAGDPDLQVLFDEAALVVASRASRSR